MCWKDLPEDSFLLCELVSIGVSSSPFSEISELYAFNAEMAYDVANGNILNNCRGIFP